MIRIKSNHQMQPQGEGEQWEVGEAAGNLFETLGSKVF